MMQINSFVPLFLLSALAGFAQQSPVEFFETKVRPVLATNCYGCHADSKMGGLRVDSRVALLEGGKPAAPADKRTLLRRVSYDLIGLPPTPEQVDAFLADNSPDAYAKVVDKLLASPQYGERWGRHWLDVARYADGAGRRGGAAGMVFLGYGMARDGYANTWRYRDWVIQALN